MKSGNMLNPVTRAQTSLLYSQDTQTTDGIIFGWHPQRGKDKMIQQKMASIFVDAMKRVLPLK